MMPAVNYGQSGANQLGDMPIHPGTYAIRQSTLRSLVADLGAQIAQNGFKWIFVMNGHGAPTHNIAINEACDFVSETYRVTMLHLTGLFRADAAIQASRREDQRQILFRRRSLLFRYGCSCWRQWKHRASSLSGPIWFRPTYRTLPSQAGRSMEELRKIATSTFRGIFGGRFRPPRGLREHFHRSWPDRDLLRQAEATMRIPYLYGFVAAVLAAVTVSVSAQTAAQVDSSKLTTVLQTLATRGAARRRARGRAEPDADRAHHARRIAESCPGCDGDAPAADERRERSAGLYSDVSGERRAARATARRRSDD